MYEDWIASRVNSANYLKTSLKELKLAKKVNQLQPDRLKEIYRKASAIRRLRGFWVTNFKQTTDEEVAALERERPTTRLLSIHVINGCNLACRACNHNSSLLSIDSKVDIDQLLQDIEVILPKIYVWSHISVIGGEPLLEPRTREVTKRIWELCQETNQPCNVKLFSNGSRLKQEKEWIVDEMLKGVVFRLTFHKPWYTIEGSKNYENAYDFMEYAKSRGLDVNDGTFELSEAFRYDDGSPRQWFDLVKYDYSDGIKYYPYEDGNPVESFKHCSCPNSQLYNGHLWKCPMISYLRESLAVTGQLEDQEWQKYLDYKPTSITGTEKELRKSFKEVLVPHDICNMCSANPKWFTATEQLDPKRKKHVEMFQPQTYDTV